jgi:hypothetical protein
MKNLFLMPDKFQDLNKTELVSAFFGTYYELLVALNDDNTAEHVVECVSNAIKQVDAENQLLWKHMWLAFCSFVMHRMNYFYFCECIKRERTRLATTHDQDFVRFIATINIASKELTRQEALFEAPRFVSDLFNNSVYHDAYRGVNVKRDALHEYVQNHADLIVFNTAYLQNNTYVDKTEFIVDVITMLSIGGKAEVDILESCLSSVLKVENKDQFKSFCVDLLNIIEKV